MATIRTILACVVSVDRISFALVHLMYLVYQYNSNRKVYRARNTVIIFSLAYILLQFLSLFSIWFVLELQTNTWAAIKIGSLFLSIAPHCLLLTTAAIGTALHNATAKLPPSMPPFGTRITSQSSMIESLPDVAAMIPCHREQPENVLRTIKSLVEAKYPPLRKHIFVGFDGIENTETFNAVVQELGAVKSKHKKWSCATATYGGSKVNISLYEHGGKTACQQKIWQSIMADDTNFLEDDSALLLFIDSDSAIQAEALRQLAQHLSRNPSQRAVTCLLTTSLNPISMLTIMQEIDWIYYQLLTRLPESMWSHLALLPGACSMVRMSSFARCADDFFKIANGDIRDFRLLWRVHLGEDRHLTSLLAHDQPGSLALDVDAVCRTEEPKTVREFLPQRRRWLLAMVSNEMHTLTDPDEWSRRPGLMLVRFLKNESVRLTGLQALLLTCNLYKSENLWLRQIGLLLVGSYIINWLSVIQFGLRRGHHLLLLTPVYCVIWALWEPGLRLHTLFTCRQKGWGGPRSMLS